MPDVQCYKCLGWGHIRKNCMMFDQNVRKFHNNNQFNRGRGGYRGRGRGNFNNQNYGQSYPFNQN